MMSLGGAGDAACAGTRRSVRKRSDSAIVDGSTNLSIPAPVARAISP
jgi:hypothetical protein